jgi:hypothetical protein
MAVDHLNCDDGISHAEFVEFDKRMAIQAELVPIWEALKLAEATNDAVRMAEATGRLQRLEEALEV